MKKLLLALALLFLPAVASAQCTGVFTDGTVCGNATGANNTPRMTAVSAFIPYISLTQYHFLIGNASNKAADTALAGDCTYGASGIICTKTNGVAFDYFATGTDLSHLTGSLTANLPLIGSGGAIGQGTRSGNTTSFGTTSGSFTNGNCVKADASGNLIDAGVTCAGSTVSGFYTLQYIAGAWTCTNPAGGAISVVGSTTSGLQECINAYQATPIAGNFRAICSPTQNITASTGVTFGPAGFGYYYDLRGCTFASTVTGATIAVKVDTFSLGSKLDWSSGMILVSGGSPTDAIIELRPATASPTVGDKYTQDSTLLFPYVINATGNARSTMAHCVHFVPGTAGNSGFNNNTIKFQAIDGGSTHSACSQLFVVDNPGGGSGANFAQNLITIPLLENPGTVGMVICTGGGSGSTPCATNTYNVSITTSQTAVTACVDTWGFRDTWNINSCSINAGTLGAGLIFEVGADMNWLIAPQLDGTAPFNNSGANNHGVHNGTQF